ncbi:MAG: cation/multidrug efflux pump [Gammaproteobacteria bacterium]|nr:MAG: cation/multidrug efflux pump [Gammaproteobacteria bacterium]
MAVGGVLGLLLLWRGLSNFLNSDLHKFRGFIQLLVSITLLAVVAALGIATVNLSTYRNLTQESTLATIEFAALRHDPGRFIATLNVTGDLSRRYELQGDQWQIDARIIKWQPPLDQLGLMPLYQFERLSGRYSDAQMQQLSEPSVHPLLQQKGVDLWALAQQFKSLPFVDASYGSATYHSMQDGLRYEISLSHSGLIARQQDTPHQREY